MSHCILEAQEPLWRDTLSPFCQMLVIISLWSVKVYGNLCLCENHSGFLVICLLWATFPAYSDFKTNIACSWPLVHVSASWSVLWEFSEGCSSFRCCARCSSRCGRCCRRGADCLLGGELGHCHRGSPGFLCWGGCFLPVRFAASGFLGFFGFLEKLFKAFGMESQA